MHGTMAHVEKRSVQNVFFTEIPINRSFNSWSFYHRFILIDSAFINTIFILKKLVHFIPTVENLKFVGWKVHGTSCLVILCWMKHSTYRLWCGVLGLLTVARWLAACDQSFGMLQFVSFFFFWPLDFRVTGLRGCTRWI